MFDEKIYVLFNTKEGGFLTASYEAISFSSELLYAMPFTSNSKALDYLHSTFEVEVYKDLVVKEFALSNIMP